MSYGKQLFPWIAQLGCQASSNNRKQVQLEAVFQLMRLDKPWGTILLLWPTMWALLLANHGMPKWTQLLIFTIGGVLMRACGCVINDYCDRDLDAKVQRTKTRPLASQAISTRVTLGLASTLALAALCLLPFLKLQTCYLAVIGFLLTLVYPTTKRWMHCPQLFLGITFAWGIPMAFSESPQGLNGLCWLLYLSTMLWVIGYDTIYAMQDFSDDKNLPIHTMPKCLNGDIKVFISAIYSLFAAGLLLIGILKSVTWCFYLSWVSMNFCLYYQWRKIQVQSEGDYLTAFKNNQWIGLIIWLGLYFGLQ